MGSTVTVKKTKKGNTITSNVNARSKKTQAELAAIGKKKPILNDSKAADQAFKDMDSDIANKKKEKKDFLKLTVEDKKNMSLEQLIELHRRMRDLGVKGKELKTGGKVTSATHKTKSGKTAKKGLYYNINQKKKAGKSATKKKSTISPKAYANMQAGFPKKKKT